MDLAAYLADVNSDGSVDIVNALLIIHNPVSDLSPLAVFTSLYELYCNNNYITDITPLSGPLQH